MEIKFKDISRLRLLSQQVAATKFKSAKEIVWWMGAMQTQDYNMALWAIGVRLQGSTEKHVQDAIDRGDIIRTHLLRPTWHFVSADDIYWMLEIAAPNILGSLKSRHRELELTDDIIKKSNKLIEKALTGNKHLTKDELINDLEKAKIATNDQRAAHILLHAELDGIICSGANIGKKQTYALLGERVPRGKKLEREEALAELAIRYFTSHGPATLQDFVWWSGLPGKDSKMALELAKSKLINENIDAQSYWFSESFSLSKTKKQSVYLLPAFDEFIISYKDRSASLLFEHNKKAISINGIFRPVIVVNGQVIGLWKRTMKKNKVIIETDFFEPPNKKTKASIEKEAEAYGIFLGREVEVLF